MKEVVESGGNCTTSAFHFARPALMSDEILRSSAVMVGAGGSVGANDGVGGTGDGVASESVGVVTAACDAMLVGAAPFEQAMTRSEVARSRATCRARSAIGP